MQKFFAEEVKDTVEKVSALGQGFRFVVLSDSHLDPQLPQWLARQKHSYENIRAVCHALQVDAIFHLGDILYARKLQDAEDFWTDENVDKWFAFTQEQLREANENAFFVAGNHDEKAVREPDRTKYYRRMVATQKERITGIVENEPYYYVDFPAKRVRCICLMSSYRENGERYLGFCPKQSKWLAQEALLAPDGWQILLFSHIYPGSISPWYPPKENNDEFARLLTAFQNKTQFVSPEFSADFSTAGTAKLVALFAGHSHADWVELPDRLPCAVVMVGCNHVHMPTDEPDWPLPEGSTVARRAYDTVTEDLWDLAVLGKDAIHTVRFGAGEDRCIEL